MRIIKLVVMGVVMVAGIAQSKAATKTNWVQTLNFKLTAWVDGSGTPSKVDSKAIVTFLSGLANATNGTNVILGTPTFSKHATLLRRQIVGDTNEGNVVYFVRDGTNDTVVSRFFVHTTIAQTSFSTPVNNFEHDLEGWALVNVPGVSFNVQGFASRKRGQLLGGGGVVLLVLGADLAGTGMDTALSTSEAVINGSLSVTGGKLE